jgi:hypothetical protein
MDFIEKIFGIAPDGGSGVLELLLFAIPIMGIAFLLAKKKLWLVRDKCLVVLPAISCHRHRLTCSGSEG